jgi:hypothetical protein
MDSYLALLCTIAKLKHFVPHPDYPAGIVLFVMFDISSDKVWYMDTGLSTIMDHAKHLNLDLLAVPISANRNHEDYALSLKAGFNLMRADLEAKQGAKRDIELVFNCKEESVRNYTVRCLPEYRIHAPMVDNDPDFLIGLLKHHRLNQPKVDYCSPHLDPSEEAAKDISASSIASSLRFQSILVANIRPDISDRFHFLKVGFEYDCGVIKRFRALNDANPTEKIHIFGGYGEFYTVMNFGNEEDVKKCC